MAYSKWLNVKVNLQSALGASKTVTAVTKAATAVCTSTAHTLTNGSYVRFIANGMSEINGRIFRIANVTANTFDLEGENSTSYGDFTSGSVQAVTFGHSFGTIKQLTGAGGEFDNIDVTTIHDSIKKSIPGLASEISYDFDLFWDLSDPAFVKCLEYSKTQSEAGVLFTFPNGGKITMYGYVGATGVPTGSGGDMVMSKVTIKASGLPTSYAS